MRRITVYLMVAAAAVLVACSGQSLCVAAYQSATELWQQRIQAAQILAVVAWEAGALLAIGLCWRHKQRLLATGGMFLLILATAYTFSAEMRLQAGTQENAVAAREAHSGRIELVKKELDKAIARRDYLQSIRKPTDAQVDELIAVRSEIEKLKASWEPLVETTRSAGIPGAALIARWTGIDINAAGDIDTLIKIIFWTMVRVFALPIAISGATLIGAEKKLMSARSSVADMIEHSSVPAVVTMRPREPMKALEKISGAAFVQSPKENETPTPLSIADETQAPEPDPATSAPVIAPSATTAEQNAESTHPSVVTFPDGEEYKIEKPNVPTKREKLRQKRERLQSEHEDVVSRFAETMEDDPAWELYPGTRGHKTGGMSVNDVYKDFLHFCDDDSACIVTGYNAIDKKWFGRYFGKHFNRSKNVNHAVYSCRKRKAIQQKRKAA